MFQYFWDLAAARFCSFSDRDPGAADRRIPDRAAVAAYGQAFRRRARRARLGGLPGRPVVMRLVDALPANGTEELIWILTGFKFVQGLIMQQALVAFGSMMADVADEHEYTTGVRHEGIFFGAVSFSGKATSGLGNSSAASASTSSTGRAGWIFRPARTCRRKRSPTWASVWPMRRHIVRHRRVVLYALQAHTRAPCGNPRRAERATPRRLRDTSSERTSGRRGLIRRSAPLKFAQEIPESLRALASRRLGLFALLSRQTVDLIAQGARVVHVGLGVNPEESSVRSSVMS